MLFDAMQAVPNFQLCIQIFSGLLNMIGPAIVSMK